MNDNRIKYKTSNKVNRNKSLNRDIQPRRWRIGLERSFCQRNVSRDRDKS